MKSEVFAAFCSIVVVVARLLTVNAEPGGTILLRLNTLENKNHASGCCSGCAGVCNYQLDIWATCDIRKKNNSDCFYGYSKTGIFSRTSSIIFGQSLGNGLRNPLAYDFSSFHGTLGFHILVTNQSELQIDEYTHHVAFYPKRNASIKWKSINLIATGSSASRLNIGFAVFCNAHYYGPSCVVGCIPGKTYICDKATGSKICSGGWLGPKCNCKQTMKNNCDISTGKKICYPPWYGENCDVKCEAKNDSSSGYSCNKTTGTKTCLDGWYGNECNLRIPLVQGVSSSRQPGPNSTTVATTRKIWQSTTLTFTSQQPSSHQSSKQPYSYILNHTSTTKRTPQSCVSSCFVTSSVATSLQPTSKSVNSSIRTARPVLGTISLSKKTFFTDVLSPTPTLGEASSKGPTGASVNIEEYTVTPEVLPETTKPTIIESHPTSWKTSSEGLIGTSVNIKEHTARPEVVLHPTSWKTSSEESIGTSVNIEEHTVKPEVVPGTTKPIIIEPHPTSWKTSSEESIGTSVNIKEHTVRPDILRGTTGIIELNPSSPHSVPETSSVGYTKEIEPGSHEARKKQDVWWMMLLPFALVALLVAAAVVILKKRGRKHAEISPMTQCEIPLEETQVQEESNTCNNQNGR